MSDIVELLSTRMSETFDGECHLTNDEAVGIIGTIERLTRERDEATTFGPFKRGDFVRKKSGSWWEGFVVGGYSTEDNPEGVAVQLDKPSGPVQIYPAKALELATRERDEARRLALEEAAAFHDAKAAAFREHVGAAAHSTRERAELAAMFHEGSAAAIRKLGETRE